MQSVPVYLQQHINRIPLFFLGRTAPNPCRIGTVPHRTHTQHHEDPRPNPSEFLPIRHRLLSLPSHPGLWKYYSIQLVPLCPRKLLGSFRNIGFAPDPEPIVIESIPDLNPDGRTWTGSSSAYQKKERLPEPSLWALGTRRFRKGLLKAFSCLRGETTNTISIVGNIQYAHSL